MLNSYGSTLVLGRIDDALAAFDKSLAIAPDQPDARKGRAAALRALGRHSEAKRRDEKAGTAVSHDAEAYYERGLALWALGKHEEAIASYEKASACHHPRALSKLAMSRLSVADWARADELAGALRTHIAEGSFVDPLTTLAFGFKSLVRLNAARTWSKSIRRSPRRPSSMRPPAEPTSCGLHICPRTFAGIRSGSPSPS